MSFPNPDAVAVQEAKAQEQLKLYMSERAGGAARGTVVDKMAGMNNELTALLALRRAKTEAGEAATTKRRQSVFNDGSQTTIDEDEKKLEEQIRKDVARVMSVEKDDSVVESVMKRIVEVDPTEITRELPAIFKELRTGSPDLRDKQFEMMQEVLGGGSRELHSDPVTRGATRNLLTAEPKARESTKGFFKGLGGLFKSKEPSSKKSADFDNGDEFSVTMPGSKSSGSVEDETDKDKKGGPRPSSRG